MNRKTLRNGVWTGSGLGVSYRYSGGVLYLETETGDEYRWTGAKWELHDAFVVDCVMSDYSLTGEVLSVTPCVGGVQTRTERFRRTIITQPRNGGLACGPLFEDREFEQACEMHADSPNNTRITAGSGSIWLGGHEFTIVGISLYDNGEPNLAYGDGGWLDQALLHDGVLYALQPPSPGNRHWYHHNGTIWVDDGLDDPETGAAPVLLTLATNGSGSGTVSGGGSYTPGATVALTATSAPGSASAGWGPSPCAPSFVMPGSPLTCTHTFNTSGGGGGSGLVRSIITTGSTVANSPVVRTQATGWQLGDYAMVATGWEPGQGWRGTVGVGGTWPETSYATESEMQQDNSKPNGWYAYRRTNGDVFQRQSGAWQYLGWTPDNYYISKCHPKALIGRIIGISSDGKDITLTRSARVTVNNALTCLDSAPMINTCIEQGTRVPSGEFAVAGVLRVGNPFTPVSGRLLNGNGKNLTKFFSPDGVPSVQVETWTPNSLISDFELRGNFKEKGWAFNYAGGSNEAGLFQPATDANLPPGIAWTRAISLTGYAPNSIARNIRVIDCAQGAVWMQGANCLAEDMESIQTWGLWAYIQWMFNSVNGAGHVFRRCTTTSPTWNPSFEYAFGATNALFDTCTSVNGSCSSNAASGHFLNMTCTIKAGCMVPGHGLISARAPVLWVNSNAGVQSSGQGNRITNPLVIQEGPPETYSGYNSLRTISVGDFSPNVRIDGGNSYAPDGGEFSMESLGPSTHIRNFQFKRYGSQALVTNPAKAVIFIKGGSVQNCGSTTTWGPSPFIAPNW